MAERRLVYLTCLAACGVFYIAYGEWFSYLALCCVAGLPWLSLILSLPAILRFQAAAGGPNQLTVGTQAQVWLLGSCALPMPPFRGKLRLRHCITGETRRYRQAGDLPTEHCGGITVTLEKLKVCDYLGLFAFPVRKKMPKTLRIYPKAVPMEQLPELERYLAQAWRPKFGGGYAENHELRLYRPGDNLNQVHWKLTAKTGKLILREPMEPARGTALLTMNLRGTPEELDRKLGRLLWLGNHLLEQGVSFEVRVLGGDGVHSLTVAGEQALSRAMDTLLCTPAAVEGDIRNRDHLAAWHCHIGGDPDET